MECNADKLILRKCMYYKSLSSLKDKSNKEKAVVHFDVENDVLIPDSLLKLMQEVAEEL